MYCLQTVFQELTGSRVGQPRPHRRLAGVYDGLMATRTQAAQQVRPPVGIAVRVRRNDSYIPVTRRRDERLPHVLDGGQKAVVSQRETSVRPAHVAADRSVERLKINDDRQFIVSLAFPSNLDCSLRLGSARRP